MTFNDINGLVQQNVQLRNQVHLLSADLDKRDMELRVYIKFDFVFSIVSNVLVCSYISVRAYFCIQWHEYVMKNISFLYFPGELPNWVEEDYRWCCVQGWESDEKIRRTSNNDWIPSQICMFLYSPCHEVGNLRFETLSAKFQLHAVCETSPKIVLFFVGSDV